MSPRKLSDYQPLILMQHVFNIGPLLGLISGVDTIPNSPFPLFTRHPKCYRVIINERMMQLKIFLLASLDRISAIALSL
jgi:hypothetical protein